MSSPTVLLVPRVNGESMGAIRGRVTDAAQSEDGTTVKLDARLDHVVMKVDEKTGGAQFVAVLDGGFEMTVSRETFIDLVLEMGSGSADAADALRRHLEETLPRR